MEIRVSVDSTMSEVHDLKPDEPIKEISGFIMFLKRKVDPSLNSVNTGYDFEFYDVLL